MRRRLGSLALAVVAAFLLGGRVTAQPLEEWEPSEDDPAYEEEEGEGEDAPALEDDEGMGHGFEGGAPGLEPEPDYESPTEPAAAVDGEAERGAREEPQPDAPAAEPPPVRANPSAPSAPAQPEAPLY
jgi:hypothetical protein